MLRLVPTVNTSFGMLMAVLFAGCQQDVAETTSSKSYLHSKGLVFTPQSIEIERKVDDPLSRYTEVRLRNTSGLNIRITDIRGTCSCAVAGRLSSDTVLPGNEILIPIKLSFPAYGKKSSTVAVFTDNESAAAILPIRLISPKAETPRLLFFPHEILVTSDSTEDQVLTGTASITAEELADTKPWLASAKVSGCDNLTVDLAVETPKSATRITLRTYNLSFRGQRNQLSEGSFNLQVFPRSESAEGRPIELNTKVTCLFPVSPIRLRPSVVVLRPGDREHQVVQLLGPGDCRATADFGGKPDWLWIQEREESTQGVIAKWEIRLNSEGDRLNQSAQTYDIPITLLRAGKVIENRTLRVRSVPADG